MKTIDGKAVDGVVKDVHSGLTDLILATTGAENKFTPEQVSYIETALTAIDALWDSLTK